MWTHALSSPGLKTQTTFWHSSKGLCKPPFHSLPLCVSSLAGSKIWNLMLFIYPGVLKKEQYAMLQLPFWLTLKSVSHSFIFKVLLSSLSEHLFIPFSSCCLTQGCRREFTLISREAESAFWHPFPGILWMPSHKIQTFSIPCPPTSFIGKAACHEIGGTSFPPQFWG